MKQSWLPAGVVVAGLALIALSVIGSRAGALHIIGILRVCLLIAGLALIAAALDTLGLVPVRAYAHRLRQAFLLVRVYLALSLSGLLVLLAYIFFISVGQWTVWPPSTDYYDRLARSLRAGHLYLASRPDSALLALSNPYDPDARKGIPGLEVEQPGTMWDMSLYDGRVYLYWGPAPALLLSGIKFVYPAQVGDQVLTLAFLLGSFLFQALLLIKIRSRFFPSVPAWTLIAGILLAGFINPAPWLLNIPRIYEAAIAAGQFFLMGGLYFAFMGLERPVLSPWRLALAALAWSCAVGSRATLAIPVAFLGLMVLLRLLWSADRAQVLRARLVPVGAFGFPFLAGAILLAWYNFLRFGSVFEFGFRYAITMLDQNRYHNVLFSPAYLLPNTCLYLFNAPSLDSVFPFVRPLWNGDYIAAFNSRFHTIYNAERIVGLLYAAPFLLFALIPLLLTLVKFLRARAGEASAVASVPTSQPAPDPFFRWLLIALSGSALLELLIVFFVYYATMRYFLDAAPTLVLLAMLGLWLGYHALERRPIWRAGYALLALGLIVFTVIMGILVGFSADVPRIRTYNPALLTHLRLFFISLPHRLGN